MYKFDYKGNDGRCNPKPGEVKEVKCGICSAQMNVERNVLGATSFAEGISGHSHLYDRFTCPNFQRIWHREISNLKSKTYSLIISMIFCVSGKPDYVKSKQFIEYEKKLVMKLNKEVIKIFKAAQKKP